MSPPDALWVLYDDTCGFCCRCADFLRAQPKAVPLTCLPRNGETAKRWFGPLVERREELVVVDAQGRVYRDERAFVMALWALDSHRWWAELASREPLRSRARGLFHWLSSRRHDLSRRLQLEPESRIARTVDLAADEPEAASCQGTEVCVADRSSH